MSELEFRVRAPLGLETKNGSHVTISEWSLAGVIFPNDVDIRPSQAILTIPFQGVDIRFPVKFKPGPRKNELLFEDLKGRHRETLSVFYRSILSGKMATTDDIITSLDTPVDLVAMGETDEEEATGTANAIPRRLRAIWSLTAYTLLAVLVFGYLGSLVWGRLSTIELDHGRVQAPIISVLTPSATYVDEIHVEVGQVVKAGDTLISMHDPDHASGVERVRSEIRQVEKRLREARRQLELHQLGRDRAYNILLDAYLTEVGRRRHQDFLGNYSLDQVIFFWFALQNFILEIPGSPGDFMDINRQLQALVDERESDLSQLKRELSNQKAAGLAADIVAPNDGIVREIFVIDNQYVGRGKDSVLIEEQSARLALGWLTDTLAHRVFLGMKSTVTFNRGGERQSFTGTVTSIEAGTDPARPDAFGMVVTVALDNADVERTRVLLTPNAPLRLTLQRELLSRLRSTEHE
jgi:multidrug resistance efflux pump